MAEERDFADIIKNKWLVEFDRKKYKDKLLGFVLAVSDNFTLIQIFDHDYFNLDGYCVFENDSIKKIRVYDDEEYFLAEVVKKKAVKPKPVSDVSLESWATILQTVNDNFNLVVVESEDIYKNQSNIGRLEKAGKKTFSLIEIYTDAYWDEKPTKYKLKNLTKVSFNNAYENTLWNISESRKKKVK
ncbi:MAG: hypothetical protein M3R11_07935 [Acidobacteriota bacterium]|nr:hypothetical protein [Acidobacteriota bacterium]